MTEPKSPGEEKDIPKASLEDLQALKEATEQLERLLENYKPPTASTIIKETLKRELSKRMHAK